MDTQEAQLLLAQALRAAGGREEDFPRYWRSLDAQAREYVADVTAKALVAFVGSRAQQAGRDPNEALDDFCRQIAAGGLQVPRR